MIEILLAAIIKNIAVVIALCISVFNLIWNIITFYHTHRKHLKITVYYGYKEDSRYWDDPHYTPEEIFVINVTNDGSKPLYYKKPFVLFRKNIFKYSKQVLPVYNPPEKLKLEVGESVDFEYPDELEYAGEWVNFDHNPVKAIVFDTFGNKYESKYIIPHRLTFQSKFNMWKFNMKYKFKRLMKSKKGKTVVDFSENDVEGF